MTNDVLVEALESPNLAIYTSRMPQVSMVLLNLNNELEVKRGYELIIQNVSKKEPKAEIQGVRVQHMLPASQEVIIGVVQDPQFGPLVMFGSGGVEVEGLQDVEFALAPLSRKEASNLIEDTWAGRKLRGYRNIQVSDRQSVLDTIIRLSQLATDHPTLSEIEINPMRVLPAGQGAFAVDVRACLRKQVNS